MSKFYHEIRDPIHVFIRLDSTERRVLDSRPFQRLRHIHQLALTYLVYPGATHRRFEHSLGVMELASRIFDIVMHPHNVTDEIRKQLPEINDEDAKRYWRRVLRMAALCHDIGHLPFSHAAEKELLPQGWNHELLSRELILSPEMREIWDNMAPPLKSDHIVKLALGVEKYPDGQLSVWETILSEIITGDVFGADRMDYLLRDSYHSGVAYGKFDHFRLIDTLRILPAPPSDESPDQSKEPMLGLEEGGLQSAEALLLARYFMYSQVYFHPIRRIYDIHLKDFLAEWLPGGRFSTETETHLSFTDNEVLAAIRHTSVQAGTPGHLHARRISQREHFRRLYHSNPVDARSRPEVAHEHLRWAEENFGMENVKHDFYVQSGKVTDFPVHTGNSDIASGHSLSTVIRSMPVIAVSTIYIAPDRRDEAKQSLRTGLSSKTGS